MSKRIPGREYLAATQKPDLLDTRKSWRELGFLLIVLALLAIFSTGCAVSPFGRANTGGAVYTLEHTTPQGSCKVSATSARDIQGARVAVGEGCTLDVQVDSTAGTIDALGVVSKALDKVPQ